MAVDTACCRVGSGGDDGAWGIGSRPGVSIEQATVNYQPTCCDVTLEIRNISTVNLKTHFDSGVAHLG